MQTDIKLSRPRITVEQVKHLLLDYAGKAARAQNENNREGRVKEGAKALGVAEYTLTHLQVLDLLDAKKDWFTKHGPKGKNGVWLRSTVAQWIKDEMDKRGMETPKSSASVGSLIQAAATAIELKDVGELDRIAERIACLGLERFYRRDSVLKEYRFDPENDVKIVGLKWGSSPRGLVLYPESSIIKGLADHGK